MSTAVAMWGESAAVRIPASVLRLASLRQGDEVEVTVNERGNIEVAATGREHRRVAPAEGITFSSLFEGYEGELGGGAWPDERMVGAELRAWSA